MDRFCLQPAARCLGVLLLAGFAGAGWAAAPPGKMRPTRADFTPRQHAEAELLAQLEKVPLVDLDTVPGASNHLRQQVEAEHQRKKERNPVFTAPLLHLARGRSDLRGLPFLPAEESLLKGSRALALDFLSRQVRIFQSRRAQAARLAKRKAAWKGPPPEEAFKKSLDRRKFVKPDDGVPALVQMLQVEERSIREYLIEKLSANPSTQATEALAKLAVFDLKPAVRQAALAALKKRPLKDVRPALLAALRYPWGPAADHAALALVALQDRQAILPVQRMMEQRDPTQPAAGKAKELVLTELVRVNHLRNCLLCHAPSLDRTDPIRGLIPTPGRPLPVLYYHETKGEFVRADVTFLRQDFSAMHKVAKPDKWPEVQRFDYLLRTRELTAREEAASARKPRTPSAYHERLRFVLAKLHALKDDKP
jgi:hypothetical protein